MLSRSQRTILYLLAVVLMGCVVAIRQPLDRMRPQFEEKAIMSSKDNKETGLLFDMSLQYMGAAAMGMRQVVASMLWIRVDDFFHTGEYDTIVPLVRLVSWLDPNNLEVYTTGSWHMDYNLTDYEQRSDRRYVPFSLSLLEEGIKNNPDIYDLYFELAWMQYHQKIKDYKKAEEWLEKASKHEANDPNTGEVMPRPGYVDRMLAHIYEKNGEFDKAEAQWKKALARSEAQARKNPKDSGPRQEIDVCNDNLSLLELRRGWRLGDLKAYDRGLKLAEGIKLNDPQHTQAVAGARKSFDKLNATGVTHFDTQVPVDAGFDFTWKKISPKIIEVSGTANLVPSENYKGLLSEAFTYWYENNQKLPADRRIKWQDGARVNIALVDADYDYWKPKYSKSFVWELDNKQTIMIADARISEGKFHLKIDMSHDPGMYPFVKDKYKLIVWFNPQEAPDSIQDRIGWVGEGLTDKKYLDTKSLPGVRILHKEIILKKDDII